MLNEKKMGGGGGGGKTPPCRDFEPLQEVELRYFTARDMELMAFFGEEERRGGGKQEGGGGEIREGMGREGEREKRGGGREWDGMRGGGGERYNIRPAASFSPHGRQAA